MKNKKHVPAADSQLELPETRVEAAETPAKTLTPDQEQPETRVEEAEKPDEVVAPEQVKPETIVEQAEKPEVVAAEPEKKVVPGADLTPTRTLDLGDVQIPVISVTNPHYGLSGKTVTITVPVRNADGSREGLALHDVPERLIK